MPLVKRSSGWFWGSKGPFDSKAKALAVARAAYAGGYKGEFYSWDDLCAINEQTKSQEISDQQSVKIFTDKRSNQK